MTGLIWTIQILQYPSFALVPREQFVGFHARHSRNITYIVLPMMAVELATAALLVINNPVSTFFWINAGGVISLWLSTFLISVPLHSALAKGKSLDVIRRLVITNWPRTILWSCRFGLLIYIFLAGVGHVSIR